MKYISILLLVVIPISSSFGQVAIEVVYPDSNQRIPSVDSTFVFGNVTKGAKLNINGFDIPVHKDGGWLAYLPVKYGIFVFHLSVESKGDTSFLELPIIVGQEEIYNLPGRPLIPYVPAQDESIMYSVGDIFEFSFQAPPGGMGWFHIGSGDSSIMLQGEQAEHVYPGDVFGESSFKARQPAEYVTYSGYYRLREVDIGNRRIYYRIKYPNNEYRYRGFFRNNYLNTDTILTVIPEFPPLIGVLSGRSQIIRTGPGLGYKLLYMPPGVKVHVTGGRDGFYELKLADGITGYTNIDSVSLLPAGASIAEGRISFISVEKTSDGARISADLGEKLPYEIDETLSPSRLQIDIFGATGDVDWIRYDDQDEFVDMVKWSQPLNGVFRITVEIGDETIGGYKPYYDGNEFVLEITEKPRSRGFFYTSLKGIKVAIDPGHSHDSGAVGPTGLAEKNANLWIAHELRLMLEDAGAEVLMTRYGHENVALYDRPTKAEKWGADLLISIHNNALPDGINPFENNGASVYYYHPHSKRLAEAIHRHLLEETGLPDHGLYYGNLVLTRPPSIPAVLVECAFMMIPEHEAMLKTDRFQRKCAAAILKGIKEYLRK